MDEKESKDREEKNQQDGDAKSRRPRRERREEAPEERPQREEPPPPEGKTRRRRAVEEEESNNQSNNLGGGWMSIGGGQKSPAAIEEDQLSPTKGANKGKHFTEETEEVVIIPDLDEEGGDGDQRIAHAPRNVARRIPSLIDLENDVKTALPTAEGGLDLSVLLGSLVPRSQLNEDDTVWTFESLLRVSDDFEVTDELTGTQKTVVSSTGRDSSLATALGVKRGVS